MVLRLGLVALIAVFVGACIGTPSDGPISQAEPTPGATPEPSPTRIPEPSPTKTKGEPPDPRRPLPAGPARLALDLEATTRILERRLDRWLQSGGSMKAHTVDTIELYALRQQRIVRWLRAHPVRARRVIARLTRPVARRFGRHVEVSRAVARLIPPLQPPVRLETSPAESPHRLKHFYETAERRFGVDWSILAAINFTESVFGRLTGPSIAGAQGPMQFLPSTWAIYGRGDIRDPRDSIMAAGRYLAASGAPGDIRGALFAYNRSYAYVDAVTTYAAQIRRDVLRYYSLYFWQVFVRTTEGDLQLTGPGADR